MSLARSHTVTLKHTLAIVVQLQTLLNTSWVS